MTHWEHHPILKNIYAGTKAWQGILNRQDPVTKSMINYFQTLVVGKIRTPSSVRSSFSLCVRVKSDGE